MTVIRTKREVLAAYKPERMMAFSESHLPTYREGSSVDKSLYALPKDDNAEC